jgi:hypothetical protein
VKPAWIMAGHAHHLWLGAHGPRLVDRGGAGPGMIGGMRLGIAHHFGWAVAVTASADHEVADRRRIELIEPSGPRSDVEYGSLASHVVVVGLVPLGTGQ